MKTAAQREHEIFRITAEYYKYGYDHATRDKIRDVIEAVVAESKQALVSRTEDFVRSAVRDAIKKAVANERVRCAAIARDRDGYGSPITEAIEGEP